MKLLLCFLLLVRYFLIKRNLLNERYSNLLVAVTGVFIAFFLYTFISGKNINAYEESRHMRLAGLVLLPLAVQSLHGLLKRYLLVVPVLMFGYAILSSLNKADRPKVISEKYRIPLGEMNTIDDYNLFKTKALKADVIYVVHADLKYDLDHCKTIYNQDDFTSLDFIKSRPKATITGKTMLFLLPERFASNGKRDAILANFTAANQQQQPEIKTRHLTNWELITVRYF
jgi:hypothetical protein